jgi:hypothetical protein
MSTAIASAPANGNGDGTLVVRPQQSVGVAAETARAQAEIQSALTVAAARPRDELDAVDRIKTSCQRPGLAEKAEYSYSRGGTEITGPSIDLLTVVSNHWGNISYGFRELSENPTESTVEAFAWDLQTNSKRAVTFTVKHVRHTRNGSYPLTDPRDRYENLANMAQRRVRACLEAIIPPDVVEDAVMQCRETLQANADVTPDAIKKLTAAFQAIGVTREQIEKRLGRRIDTMQPAQLVSLRRVYKSIQDGMSKPVDWFESGEPQPEKPATAADAAKDALRKKTTPQPPIEPVDAGDRPQTSDEPDADYIANAKARLAEAKSMGDLSPLAKELCDNAPNDATRNICDGLAITAEERIANSRGERSNKPAKQGELMK